MCVCVSVCVHVHTQEHPRTTRELAASNIRSKTRSYFWPLSLWAAFIHNHTWASLTTPVFTLSLLADGLGRASHPPTPPLSAFRVLLRSPTATVCALSPVNNLVPSTDAFSICEGLGTLEISQKSNDIICGLSWLTDFSSESDLEMHLYFSMHWNIIPFHGWVAVYCVDIPQCVYPFINRHRCYFYFW